MNVLFDTNVVLDALLDREPWAEAAASLLIWSGFSERRPPSTTSRAAMWIKKPPEK